MKRLEKGFTLIELMIVDAIIAILAAVAAPRFGKQIKKARDSKALAIVGNWRSASQLYYADNGDYASSYGNLADNVDATTLNATSTADAASVTAVSSSTSGTAVYTKAGTSSNGSNNNIKFDLTTTDGSITIDSANGNNTSDIAWNTL